MLPIQLYLEPVDACRESERKANAEYDDWDGVPGAGRAPVGEELRHLELEGCSQFLHITQFEFILGWRGGRSTNWFVQVVLFGFG